MLGFHPELVQQYQSQLDIFTDYVKTTRYIGEVGLDFSVRDETNRQNQVAVFSEIVRLCNDSPNKIMSIHSRRAEADCLKILKNYVGKVILHWYSGSQRNLQEALERNYYFSVNHQMLLSNSGRSIVDRIPLDQLLFESDAPFTRGLERRYSITFVDKIFEYLSQSRKIALDNLNVIIKNNFKNLLG